MTYIVFSGPNIYFESSAYVDMNTYAREGDGALEL